MPEDEPKILTLERAAAQYLETVAHKVDRTARAEVQRFVQWYGPHREMAQIKAHEMTQYLTAQGEHAADLAQRLTPVKEFLAHARKETWTTANLGVHLRVKAARGKVAGGVRAVGSGPRRETQMSAGGLAAAEAELEGLKAQRPKIAELLRLAMADKDFRENAPLDAARDQQAHLETRIRDLEGQIRTAVIDDGTSGPSGGAHLGSRVRAINLVTGQVAEYTLVGQNEVEAAAGRISVASPIGLALLGRGQGEDVEISVPSGTIQLRVERVEG